MSKIQASGTISIVGDIPQEVRCPNECDGGDVCVDTITGQCRICKNVFTIQPTNITVVIGE